MSERKSSRARKTVEYAGFVDDASDDDFAESNPSKLKKQKTKRDEMSDNGSQKKARVMDEPNSIKKRKSLTEKMYENELHEALQLSLLETSGNNDLESHLPSSPAVQCMQVEAEVTHSKAPELTREEEVFHSGKDEASSFDEEPPPLLMLKPNTIGTVMDDRIECIGEDGDDAIMSKGGRRQQRRAAAKRSVIVAEDDDSGDESDFNPGNKDSDSDVDDDNVDDDDSDFDDGQKKKRNERSKTKTASAPVTKSRNNKTATVKKSDQKNVGTAANEPSKVSKKSRGPCSDFVKDSSSSPRPTYTVTPVSTSTPAGPVKLNSRPMASSSPVPSIARSTERLSQSWKPPGVATDNNNSSTPTMRSPSLGLRLGLSRNQRVKPLHSSVM